MKQHTTQYGITVLCTTIDKQPV